MDDLLKMDIFFVVATLATVIIATLMIVALAFVIKVLRTINRISEEVEEEAVAIREDIAEARQGVREFQFSDLFALFGKSAKRIATRSKRK